MNRLCSHILMLFGFGFVVTSASGQADSLSGDQYILTSIILDGNERTKDKVILRELDVHVGDTIAAELLPTTIKRNEFQVLNTGIFTNAWIESTVLDVERGHLQWTIRLVEAWSIFPIPIFELGDRNFNIWWTEQNRALDRINFGLHYLHNNPFGFRDQLKINFQYGYTQKYELDYNFPNINRNAALALNFNVLHTRNREIPYNTIDNIWRFYRDNEQIQLYRFRVRAGISYRPKIRSAHGFSLAYRQNTISAYANNELNANFFNNKEIQQYFSLKYNYLSDHRDIRPYPMKGYLLNASLTKDGLGIMDDLNALDLALTLEGYHKFNDLFSVSTRLKGKTGLVNRSAQPYFNTRAFGFGRDFIRGYELYVIDGIDYAYAKTSLHLRLFDRVVPLGRLMPIKAWRDFPVKVFMTINNDLGAANNPRFGDQNDFANRLLWGTGIGLDFLMLYDKLFRLEYSRNHLNEKGLFLSFRFNFIPRA